MTGIPTPTAQAYGDLNRAYEFFNERLFGGDLPGCLITFQRKKGCAGYFSGRRFRSADGSEVTDEIALNPVHFHMGTVEVLQTLVHEMVHLWQHHYGTPSRATYHNTEWADKMEAVGLIPSDTGQPGGKRVGQKVSDYPAPGGPFELACDDLVRDGYGVAWIENTVSAAAAIAGDSISDDGEGDEAEDAEAAAAAAKKKVKYSCPACGCNAWGKPGLHLICGTDKVDMAAVD
ncbi:SprT-like family protein [Azospirillum brasilense]|nr:SprT-like family protein [Azospirillum brasilense]